MDKPAAIRQLQTALRLELQPFPGPPEQLEELTRYRYQNHYALDAEGREEEEAEGGARGEMTSSTASGGH